MDEEIRRRVEQKLAEQLPDVRIEVGGARRIAGRAIAIYDVKLALPTVLGNYETIAAIDEVILTCNPEITELVIGDVDVKKIQIKRPKLWLRRLADGRWNIEDLPKFESTGARLAPILVQGGTIVFTDERPGVTQLQLKEVGVSIEPVDSEAEAISSQKSLNSASGDIYASDPAQSYSNGEPQTFQVRGSFGGPHVGRCQFSAEIVGQSECRAALDLENLRYGPQIHAWIQPLLPQELQQASFAGRIDGRATGSCNFAGQSAPRVEAYLTVSEGRLVHPRLPRPITEIRTAGGEAEGGIHIDNEGLRIERLLGRSDSTSAAISLTRSGWNAKAPISVAAQAGPIRLNSAIKRVMPTEIRREWDKYKPEGVVHARALKAQFDGERWRPVRALLEGSELSFEADKFPYRLRDGHGTLKYSPAAEGRPPVLDINLIGYGGKRAIHVDAQVIDPRPHAAGWARVHGEGIELEEDMIRAIPEKKARAVIGSLHPSGKVDLDWTMHRAVSNTKPKTELTLSLQGVAISYDGFKYPLENVHGIVRAEGKSWTFHDLQNDGLRRITCNGWLRPVTGGSHGNELYLNFSGQQIPLDDVLFKAVPSQVKEAWQQLRARGEFDLHTAEVRHRDGETRPRITVKASPRPETARIKPAFFHYDMEELSGQITYEQGEVWLRNMRANHGSTAAIANGHGKFNEDGSWHFQLTDLEVDRLMPTQRALLAAVPSTLQNLAEQLQPTGKYFSISNGTLQFSKPSSPIKPMIAIWDVLVDCDRTDLQCGLPLESIFGAVRLQGESNGLASYTAGELDLESVTYQGYRLNNVRGPFFVDQGQCLLGEYAPARQGLPTQRIQATAYGGQIEGDARIVFLNQPKYEARMNLRGADLRQIVLERFNNQSKFRGKVDANVVLQGSGKSILGLEATGNLNVRDAELYEHSLLVGMLKVLQNKTPDTTAFNQCEIDFRLQGKDITLTKLNFRGDAVSLYGGGRTNFDQELSLGFYGQVGANDRFPLLKKLTGKVSEQTLRLYVSGTVSEPLVQTEAFPGINEFFERLQADWQYPVFGPPSRQAQRASPTGAAPR